MAPLNTHMLHTHSGTKNRKYTAEKETERVWYQQQNQRLQLHKIYRRPQFVDYWFLISRPHGFSMIEFITIIYNFVY